MLLDALRRSSLELGSVSGPRVGTLVALLQRRGSETPERTAFTFVADGEDDEESITYGELARLARGVGSLLQQHTATGARVLLLFPPGLDFVAGFFGCLYAGMIAVPTYPPDPRRLEVTLSRLQAIVEDAGVEIVLTTDQLHSAIESLGVPAALASLEWVTIVEGDALHGGWRDPAISAKSLAYLQYTSGSTGVPRGVMVSHGNLIANLEAIQHHFEHTDGDRGVIWLPPYHDMGLIGGILQPVFSGFPTSLMSPLSFLQKPLRWLQAVSRVGATVSGGPNFAYDLCVRRISVEERRDLDLSSWTLAFTGAENVRQETLESFVAAFEPCGFRREAFYPCYGLAEATLMVSGGKKSRPPITRVIDRSLLKCGQAVDSPNRSSDQSCLVSCGQAVEGHQVRIVDPHTMQERAEGWVGEIWVRGPSIGGGYWNRPQESHDTFRAQFGDAEFLRTGDLGFVRDGELFVTGRLKDLIVVRGRNHYPDDIEASVQQSHPGLRRCGAAFALSVDGEERLVVVQAVDPSLPNAKDAIKAVRRVIAGRHGIKPAIVALVRSESIPRTSNGKVQRNACRMAFVEGRLETIHEWRDPTVRVVERQVLGDVLPAKIRQALVTAGVAFEVAPRSLNAIRCQDAARVSGRQLEQVVKTLVIRLNDGRFALAVLPGNRTLSLEKVSRAMGAEASMLASAVEAVEITGHPIGGITPIACADSALPILADRSLLALGTTAVNVGGGRPDVGLEISAQELLQVSLARCVDICVAASDGSAA